MKNKKYLITLIIILIIAMYSIISFPIQKHFAKNKVSEYISLQGASLENIKSKQLYKDNKIGGYIFKITYKNDLEHSYEYHYYLREKGSKEIISDIMYCSVYDSSNSSIDSPYKNVKYPPIG